ncbi:DUF4332 domain-containing protein [Legionella sp. 27cVA30]|uniref:DUF4332 domain-containing protein n=1 Tax=Legionella sp. 27cVA30 TaxID=2905657 RepID=UPI0020A01F19|nr:DUF4332 domain-containing protein [Legionella sp. 27cVA30]MCP0913858.1 DUF4332 domain-containing protein [Legionella sp. 27cVA30]
MQKIANLESIGVKFTELLKQVGIEHQEQLLARCGPRKERQALAKQLGINAKLLLKWTQQADLARISGIGDDYAELLLQVRIDSVPALAQSNSKKLLSHMQQINEQNNLVKKLPNVTHLESWIEQAKNLPALVERDLF